MVSDSHHVYEGAARTASCHKTVASVVASLSRISDFRGHRLLDVGCGYGTFTRPLGEHFDEVVGIDVQTAHVEAFRAAVRDDPKFTVHEMSASDMGFADDHFDSILTIETFEHIEEIHLAARECARVLRPGGELVITVPNRWFPFENHGMKIGSWEKHGRIPLLPWIPPLHDRWSLARVFTVRALDELFGAHGLSRTHVGYLWPTFEHRGNPLQPLLKPLFPLMRRLETSPLAMFGTSVMARYVLPRISR